MIVLNYVLALTRKIRGLLYKHYYMYNFYEYLYECLYECLYNVLQTLLTLRVILWLNWLKNSSWMCLKSRFFFQTKTVFRWTERDDKRILSSNSQVQIFVKKYSFSFLLSYYIFENAPLNPRKSNILNFWKLCNIRKYFLCVRNKL